MPEPNAPAESPSFESSLAELQRIVTDLEDGRVPLEESLARFERGISLLKSCYQTLEHAEQKIERLVGQKPDGTPITQPFDASATADPSDQSAGKRKSRKPKSESKPLRVADPIPAPAKSEEDSDDGFLF